MCPAFLAALSRGGWVGGDLHGDRGLSNMEDFHRPDYPGLLQRGFTLRALVSSTCRLTWFF